MPRSSAAGYFTILGTLIKTSYRDFTNGTWICKGKVNRVIKNQSNGVGILAGLPVRGCTGARLAEKGERWSPQGMIKSHLTKEKVFHLKGNSIFGPSIKELPHYLKKRGRAISNSALVFGN